MFSLAQFANGQKIKYSKKLSEKLNADEYGMKKYVLVLLKKGTNTSIDKAERDLAFAGHMKNIGRLAEEKKLVVAGPFMKDQMYSGLFIFNADSIEKAKEFTDTDPAVKAGYLEPEFHLWYGTAALQETVNIHKKIQKKNI
jgi:uncharacterized protein